MSGVMVTCTRSKESRSQKEVIDLFEEVNKIKIKINRKNLYIKIIQILIQQYAKKLYSDDNDSKDKEEDKEEEEELDLEAQVAKELAELKQPTKDNKQSLFANISTSMDCGNCFFLCMNLFILVKRKNHC